MHINSEHKLSNERRKHKHKSSKKRKSHSEKTEFSKNDIFNNIIELCIKNALKPNSYSHKNKRNNLNSISHKKEELKRTRSRYEKKSRHHHRYKRKRSLSRQRSNQYKKRNYERNYRNTNHKIDSKSHRSHNNSFKDKIDKKKSDKEKKDLMNKNQENEEDKLYLEIINKQTKEIENNLSEEDLVLAAKLRREKRLKLIALSKKERENIKEPKETLNKNENHTNQSFIIENKNTEKISKSIQKESDLMDMFDLNDEEVEENNKTNKITNSIRKGMQPHDNWDDSDGFYMFHSGDVLNNRYEVLSEQGRGVFSSVFLVRDKMIASDYVSNKFVVKVIRNNDVMYKSGVSELNFLKKLSSKDPLSKKHCIKLHSHFEHRNHLCMVFDAMNLNLRQLLKRCGFVGINVFATKSYATQLFIALKHLKNCQIVHADIKPDNILVNDKRNIVKLCDFGSATDINMCSITPYMCSRYYRSPEVILGCEYGYPIDVWAIGCVLYELYTGKILFKGESNNSMLLQFIKLRGRFPVKMLKKGLFVREHFDADFVFEENKMDELSQMTIKKPVRIYQPTRDLLQAMHPPDSLPFRRILDNEKKKVVELKDLIERCLQLDPKKRITPEKALEHPFIRNEVEHKV